MKRVVFRWFKHRWPCIQTDNGLISHLSNIHSTPSWNRWRLTVRCGSWWPRPRRRSWRKSRTIGRKARRTTPWSFLWYQMSTFFTLLFCPFIFSSIGLSPQGDLEVRVLRFCVSAHTCRDSNFYKTNLTNMNWWLYLSISETFIHIIKVMRWPAPFTLPLLL